VAVQKKGGKKMKKIPAFLDHFSADDDAQYTILIGLITVVAIAVIAAVSIWVQIAWTSVNSTLANSPSST